MTNPNRVADSSRVFQFRFDGERAGGLLIVLGIHVVLLHGLWTYRLIPSSIEAATLFVDFIAPPSPEKMSPKTLPPRPVVKKQAQPPQIVSQTQALAPTDYAAPPAPPASAPQIQAPQTTLPAGPVSLGSELAVACPDRAAPAYPAISRRLGETGQVVLRVELNESGAVAQIGVDRSSGYTRLDDAATSAVRNWHCTPATRNGHPVRAVALQPFNFILQGN